MRFLQINQLWLAPSSQESEVAGGAANPVIRELCQMSQILDELPNIEEVYQRIRRDLVGDRRTDCGRTGLTAEQALRAALIKEKLALTWRELEFHLSDSLVLRSFAKLEPTKRVSKSILNRDVRLISEETWQFFNEGMKQYAAQTGMEDGACLRSDTTATETNIHHPTDSRLLCDCIRVLTRLMQRAADGLGVALEYCDHNRRAAKRLYSIHNAKNDDVRRGHYRDLIRVAEWTRDYAKMALAVVQAHVSLDLSEGLLRDAIVEEIQHYLPLTEKVLSQTIRRVLNGENVPAAEKVVSIFEPHTDIIEKGCRDTIFGHKVCIGSGKSGLILDCIVLEGNPADSTLVNDILQRHRESYGAPPEQIVFDGGFSSAANAAHVKEQGVRDAVFAKRKGFDPLEYVSSMKVLKALMHFRAGIEAGISVLKRAYGMTRVFAKGWRAFKTSLLNGVAAFNLTLIARYQLQRA